MGETPKHLKGRLLDGPFGVAFRGGSFDSNGLNGLLQLLVGVRLVTVAGEVWYGGRGRPMPYPVL